MSPGDKGWEEAQLQGSIELSCEHGCWSPWRRELLCGAEQQGAQSLQGGQHFGQDGNRQNENPWGWILGCNGRSATRIKAGTWSLCFPLPGLNFLVWPLLLTCSLSSVG